MKDIAPELLERIEKEFKRTFEADSTIRSLYKKIKDGTATYEDAQSFAVKTGELLADTFKRNLSSEILPDGRFYYNIASRILSSTLGKNHDLISDYSADVQNISNIKAGIRIKAQTADPDQERIDGIVDIVSGKSRFDDIAYMLKEPVINFGQAVVDETLRKNIEFQGKSGKSPKVIRRATGKPCRWCAAIAGTYTYPDVPKDVFRRHQRCRCIVEYDPGTGRRQNVHSKEWTDEAELEKRKSVGLETPLKKEPDELERTIKKSNELTKDERRALNRYISSDAYKINEKLRNDSKLTADDERLKRNLDTALEKMQNYSGNLQRSVYFSNTKSRDAFLRNYKKYDTITYKEFLSTTKGDIYNPDADIQIYIENSRRGKDISAYNKGEQEVLYSRNSSFKIKHIVMENGTTYILLEEK